MLHDSDEDEYEEEVVQDRCSFEIDHMAQCDLDGLKDARRSRTAARSESSTLPTHRPAIESSSSSRPCASSIEEHIDGDQDAM